MNRHEQNLYQILSVFYLYFEFPIYQYQIFSFKNLQISFVYSFINFFYRHILLFFHYSNIIYKAIIILKYSIFNTSQKSMGANLQSNQKHRIHFIIQKQVQYGKAIYVVGNIPELGGWVIQNSLKLSWCTDHYWTGFVNLPTNPLESPIQYKYVVANWNDPENGIAQWEAGKRNRIIEGPLDCQHILCENTWNMEKITLNLIVPQEGKLQEYSVVGDCKELGGWKKSYKLKLNEKKNIMKDIFRGQESEGKKYVVFSISFQIFRAKQRIHYYYIKKNHGTQIERNPGRKYDLQKDFSCHPKCLRLKHSRGDTEMFQICNFKQLNYSKVTQNIFLGPYVQQPEDFQTLKSEGVSSILSIQTNEDLASHRVTQEYIQHQSKKHGIEQHTYSIQDMSKRDFLEKCSGAIELLDKLASGDKKVYVHCSAGVYRSPQIVVLYLILKENYSLQGAIKFVKQRHRFAKPNPEVLNHALNFFSDIKQSNLAKSNS